jgi:hypothetical protein
MSDIEREIQAKGLTAPRVTPERIEAVISGEYYFTGNEIRGTIVSPHLQSLSLLTVCVLVLVNGFTVIGKSACVSPENFDEELGRKIARRDAVDQIWALEGYALKGRMLREQDGKVPA